MLHNIQEYCIYLLNVYANVHPDLVKEAVFFRNLWIVFFFQFLWILVTKCHSTGRQIAGDVYYSSVQSHSVIFFSVDI